MIRRASLRAAALVSLAPIFFFSVEKGRLNSKPADKAQVSRDQVLAYLDDHPEMINEASQHYELKRRKEMLAESAKAIALRRTALEQDPRDFVANPNGKITVVEFFDYRCPYCKAALPAIQSLILQNPDIRYVFKEFPIIPDADGKVEVSLRASEAALAAARAGKYQSVHDAMMATSPLDDDGIAKVLRDHGLDPATTRRRRGRPAPHQGRCTRPGPGDRRQRHPRLRGRRHPDRGQQHGPAGPRHRTGETREGIARPSRETNFARPRPPLASPKLGLGASCPVSATTMQETSHDW